MEHTLNLTHDDRAARALRAQPHDDAEELFGDEEELASIGVESIITLTTRLAQVLAEEVDLLADMRVRDIAKLQKEKLQLLEALEAQKRFIDRNPEIMEDISDEEALELAQIVEIFQTVMKENHRRLLIAREVNRTVVEAIAEAVHEAGSNGIYDRKGMTDRSDGSLSMSLNQTI